MKGEKNLFSMNWNTKTSFNKLKAESSLHICVKFYFNRVCKTHKNFQLFIKFLLKISFSAIFLFSFVRSKLEMFFHHLWNFYSIITNGILLMHFLRKCRSNIYLNKKLLIKKSFQKSFELFFSETKYLIYVQLFLNSRFSRKCNLTVDMVWLMRQIASRSAPVHRSILPQS